jgi:hypothetical protein
MRFIHHFWWILEENMKKPLAEFIGTFTLVLLGCGAAVIAGEHIGFMGISFAFGLALIGMAYGIGPVSGCHINPAVTLGAVVAGRMKASEAGSYIIVPKSLGELLGPLFCLSSPLAKQGMMWPQMVLDKTDGARGILVNIQWALPSSLRSSQHFYSSQSSWVRQVQGRLLQWQDLQSV